MNPKLSDDMVCHRTLDSSGVDLSGHAASLQSYMEAAIVQVLNQLLDGFAGAGNQVVWLKHEAALDRDHAHQLYRPMLALIAGAAEHVQEHTGIGNSADANVLEARRSLKRAQIAQRSDDLAHMPRPGNDSRDDVPVEQRRGLEGLRIDAAALSPDAARLF